MAMARKMRVFQFAMPTTSAVKAVSPSATLRIRGSRRFVSAFAARNSSSVLMK